MKTRSFYSMLTAALLGLALAVGFTGCGTPAQNLATANYLAGNAYATYELGKTAANLKGLQDLAAALPGMAEGKVSPYQMGVINAELRAQQADVVDGKLKDQIGSLISAVSQAAAASNGGNPTINTAVITAALTDAANGIQHGIDFWKGQMSIKNPTSG